MYNLLHELSLGRSAGELKLELGTALFKDFKGGSELLLSGSRRGQTSSSPSVGNYICSTSGHRISLDTP